MPTLGLDLMEFLKFTELPGLLGEQFFRTLDSNEDSRLTTEDFVGGILRLYKGSKAEISEMLFCLLDFNHKGYITLRDMRCILPYLPNACLRCGTRFLHAWNMEEKMSICFAQNEILRYEEVLILMDTQQELFDSILEALITSLPAIIDEAVGCVRPSICSQNQCKETADGVSSLKPLRYEGRKYLFDLRNQALYFYNSVDPMSLKGIIPIKEMFVSPEGELEFTLRASRVLYAFQSASRIERDEWVDRLLKENNFRWFDDFYETKESIGSGAFGQVLKAVNKISGIVAAVKIINKQAMDAKAESRLRREISILKHAVHPNLLEFYDVFETSERLYLVTEFLDGGSLFDYLQSNSFCVPEDFVRTVVSDLAKGLTFLHESGIVHRDVKLENVMMRKEKSGTLRAVLIDFGLSCLLGPDQTASEPVGTLKYVAPEIISRLSYREKVDWWSLGVVMYIMIQGKVPFYGKTEQDVALRILKRHLNFSTERWTCMSKSAASVVSGLLCRKADKRMSLSEVLNSDWLNRREVSEKECWNTMEARAPEQGLVLG